jgi:hypothetical protein
MDLMVAYPSSTRGRADLQWDLIGSACWRERSESLVGSHTTGRVSVTPFGWRDRTA